MTIGTIIGARISNVLETVLRFGCGIAVIGVATEVVSQVAHSYRKITSSKRDDVRKAIKEFEQPSQGSNDNTSEARQPAFEHSDITTSIMVQWHVEILSSLVMMGIFIVACELAVGDFTESLVQSLSVGIGFGLKDILADAVYGTMVMMQGYGKVGTVINIDTEKGDQKPSAHRICQAHLTHVVLIKVNDAQKDELHEIQYTVKTWSNFYNNLRYTMPKA
tara:strand:- start:1982 stop:2641 length:660 start_codon:yes stop_codon:yes gene_type:complete